MTLYDRNHHHGHPLGTVLDIKDIFFLVPVIILATVVILLMTREYR